MNLFVLAFINFSFTGCIQFVLIGSAHAWQLIQFHQIREPVPRSRCAEVCRMCTRLRNESGKNKRVKSEVCLSNYAAQYYHISFPAVIMERDTTNGENRLAIYLSLK